MLSISLDIFRYYDLRFYGCVDWDKTSVRFRHSAESVLGRLFIENKIKYLLMSSLAALTSRRGLRILRSSWHQFMWLRAPVLFLLCINDLLRVILRAAVTSMQMLPQVIYTFPKFKMLWDSNLVLPLSAQDENSWLKHSVYQKWS